jgi:Tfp pilus assembly protein PilF
LVEKEAQAQTIDTFAELAWCYRRMQRHDEARQLWHRALEKLAFHPLPYIELAKHYEHRVKDYDQALALIDRALRGIELGEELRGETDFHRADLEKRRLRVQRKKVGKEKWRP